MFALRANSVRVALVPTCISTPVSASISLHVRRYVTYPRLSVLCFNTVLSLNHSYSRVTVFFGHFGLFQITNSPVTIRRKYGNDTRTAHLRYGNAGIPGRTRRSGVKETSRLSTNEYRRRSSCFLAARSAVEWLRERAWSLYAGPALPSRPKSLQTCISSPPGRADWQMRTLHLVRRQRIRRLIVADFCNCHSRVKMEILLARWLTDVVMARKIVCMISSVMSFFFSVALCVSLVKVGPR